MMNNQHKKVTWNLKLAETGENEVGSTELV